MATLPEWCSQDYLARYINGQIRITNRYIDACYHGEISGINLDETTGRLTIAYHWFAAGVDEHNRCSLRHRKAWVEVPDPVDKIDLWTNMQDQTMMLYIGRPVSDGRLIVDGGELMEAVYTFLPPGVMAVWRTEVRPADPQNPVDRSIRYVKGHMPGGTVLQGGVPAALYRPDADGDPKRVNLGDDGT